MKKLFSIFLAVTLIGAYGLGAAPVFAGEEDPDDIKPVTIVPPAQEIEEIEESETPLTAEAEQAPVYIPSERPPLASFATWAILNLIFLIGTAVITGFLLVTWLRNRAEMTGLRKWLHLSSIAPTAIAAILFATTQNMSLPAALADNLTVWHIVILAAAIALTFVSISKTEVFTDKA